jgi:acyl-CoA thioesterase
MDNEVLIEKVKADKFARFVGIELVSAGEGRAVAKLELTENHLNGAGRVQGGAIFTLADYAFAAASNSRGHPTVGINVSISYYKAPMGRSITATASEISEGKRISGYNVDVHDEDGSLVARFVGMGYTSRK